MKAVHVIVEEIIKKSPFLEEALAEGLINLSSLSRQIKSEIDEELGKDVKIGAIVMALKRLSPRFDPNFQIKIKKVVQKLGDITVRSKITYYTFENSESLIEHQAELLRKLKGKKDIFFAFSQGVYETTIILSDSEHQDVDVLFKNEKIIQESTGLSSLTIKLPSENSDVSGIYYFILKKLAWEGINILDIISTMHEFTIIVNDENIDRAFSILKNINKSI
ncbi:MAG: aspartate kinase [Flavobacteriales bacterium CG18_big_fil_WC_8_21_14_2_50_32_9]|nr:MAG: aspartate kinase [Flavobacteriales bacterium CG18_big_fil_WC_8_21_14_2_50_32_9]PJC62298.1 MAG: aspartate kinase [Flavobacteriales bacterium CG_4_9_14_0_2_um_filter_32_27]